MAWSTEDHAIYLMDRSVGYIIGTSTSTVHPRSRGALYYIFGAETFQFQIGRAHV